MLSSLRLHEIIALLFNLRFTKSTSLFAESFEVLSNCDPGHLMFFPEFDSFFGPVIRSKICIAVAVVKICIDRILYQIVAEITSNGNFSTFHSPFRIY